MDPGLLELIAAGAPTDEVAIIVRLNPGSKLPPDLRLISHFGDIATARAARGKLAAIHDHPSVASLKAPRVYAGETGNPFTGRPAPEPGLSEADPAPIDTDIRRPPSIPETGRGTVVAVIDWGIDFAHPDFRDAQGDTRLIALWDQRANGKPSPYGYGRVHSRSEIDQALGTADPFAALDYMPSSSAAPSHGTHVMGIAAGNGHAGGPSGIAPEADLIFVHLGPGLGDLGNSVDLLEAIDFVVRSVADRPVVINMSIGRHAGPHDGSLLIERAIDWLIVNRLGTVVVQSTGNYFSRNVHMEGRLREARTARLPFQLPRSDAHQATVELWYKGADRFIARATAPDGTSVAVELGASAPLVDGNGQELARLYHRHKDPNNGDNLIALVLRPMAPAGQWSLEITGTDVVDGRWHAWIERNAACPQCQATFVPERASRKTTTGSICNAMRTIAVGAYDGHHPEQPLALFSSVGPTRDGRQKPLLAAPGVRVLSVRSRQSVLESPSYVRMNGTSMAAPHVAGTVALMLEAAGSQPVSAIRRALFASLDAPPRQSAASASRWGYGVLNIPAAVAAARRLRVGHQPVPAPIEFGAAHTEAKTLIEQQEMTVMEHEQEDFDSAETTYRFSSHFNEAYENEPPPAGAPDPAAAATTIDPVAPPAVNPDPATAADPWGFGPSSEPTAAPQPAEPSPAAAMPEPLPPPPAMTGHPPPTSGPPSSTGQPTPDPKTLINMAVNPQVPSTQIVGWPGTRLAVPLIAGDIIVKGKGRHRRRAAMVSRPKVLRQRDVRARRGKAGEAGFYAETIGENACERIAGPDGLLLSDVTIIRSSEAFVHGGETSGLVYETTPPVVGRPTIRSGSRGSAVTEAQTRLNSVHTSRTGSGQSAIDRCPLVVDGIFGKNTRGATISFQRIAFPGQPNEWDGIIGPKTWTALIAASTAIVPTPPPPPPPPPPSGATIEFVLDDDGDHRVDGRAPVATALMFGLWDKAYTAAGNVRNEVRESGNFVGSDARRFYIRVSDPQASGRRVTARWGTLNNAGANDDFPAEAGITLNETSRGSHIFVSKALMLVIDEVDAGQRTHSGFSTGPDAGLRRRGQRNHRLRKADMEGSVKAEYTSAGGGAVVEIVRPVFERHPEARTRLSVRVINYGNHATQAQIDAHFAQANLRWSTLGLRIDPLATVDRPIPAGMLDGTGSYPGFRDNPEEIIALADLIGTAPNIVTPDNTVTVVFVRLNNGASAYVTTGLRRRSALGERFFVFMNPDDPPEIDSLAHEFHHLLFNRFDFPADAPGRPNIALRPFFPFNTNPVSSYAPAVTVPDVRLNRRIQNRHSRDPNADANNDNIINWIKRRRTTRFDTSLPDNLPTPGADPAADATTGNTLTTTF